MNEMTHSIARSLVLILLATFTNLTSWAQLSGDGSSEHPYLINKAEDWTTFTNMINGGDEATAYYKLTDDITLGSQEDPITTVVGLKDYPFKGVFDGDFHTIHLYMVRNENNAAPFGITCDATVKNLSVDGTIITDHKFAAGIIAYANNSDNTTSSIINCISSVNIHCDNIVTIDKKKPYDCSHGGLVGQNENGFIYFENCIFNGSIVDGKTEKTANRCAGIISWVNDKVTYVNCTMAGYIDVLPSGEKVPDSQNLVLDNSMATFHRCAKTGVTVVFDKDRPSYYVNDYTYTGLDKQGTAALDASPDNTISMKYLKNDGKDEVVCYVPGVKISGNTLTYYGRPLAEGTDYVARTIEIDGNKYQTYKGINNFGGAYSDEARVPFAISTWNADAKTGWCAIASPIKGQQFSLVENLISTENQHNIYRYDEATIMWEEYRVTDNLFDSFENGRGYLYRSTHNGDIDFNGRFNVEDVKYTLSYTEMENSKRGFNLIGNPYPFDIYKGVAISNDYLEDGYSVLTEKGTWTFMSDAEAVPSCKAILVQAKEANTLVIKGTDEAPTKKASNDEIWFTVKNAEFEDVAHVAFKEGRGFNKMPHYNEDAPMLYVNNNGEQFASADLSDGTDVINLGFKASKMSRYTISVKVSGNIDYLHIIDRLTGNDVDMLVEDEYSFIGTSNDNADRFIVKLDNNTMSETFGYSQFAWQNGNNVIVNGEGELQVFDVTGRMVMNNFISGEESIYIPTSGVFVLRLLGDDMKTQKIVVK